MLQSNRYAMMRQTETLRTNKDHTGSMQAAMQDPDQTEPTSKLAVPESPGLLDRILLALHSRLRRVESYFLLVRWRKFVDLDAHQHPEVNASQSKSCLEYQQIVRWMAARCNAKWVPHDFHHGHKRPPSHPNVQLHLARPMSRRIFETQDAEW